MAKQMFEHILTVFHNQLLSMITRSLVRLLNHYVQLMLYEP